MKCFCVNSDGCFHEVSCFYISSNFHLLFVRDASFLFLNQQNHGFRCKTACINVTDMPNAFGLFFTPTIHIFALLVFKLHPFLLPNASGHSGNLSSQIFPIICALTDAFAFLCS
jgi:hypothetical protein